MDTKNQGAPVEQGPMTPQQGYNWEPSAASIEQMAVNGYNHIVDQLNTTRQVLFTHNQFSNQQMEAVRAKNTELEIANRGLREQIKALEALKPTGSLLTDVSEAFTHFAALNADWVAATFGADVMADVTERGFRFGEEAVELLQAVGLTRMDVITLVNYVYDRPVGDMANEIGGCMVTLPSLAHAVNLNLGMIATNTLAACWKNKDAIRIKGSKKPSTICGPSMGGRAQ
jgi:hypothetical protein